jgi:hypothetical protein
MQNWQKCSSGIGAKLGLTALVPKLHRQGRQSVANLRLGNEARFPGQVKQTEAVWRRAEELTA